MNKKILDILEFDKVKQLFEPYLQTEQGGDGASSPYSNW